MSNRKRVLRLIGMIAALLCASILLMGSTLIEPAAVKNRQSEYTTAEVKLGTVQKTIGSEASIRYPVQVEVRNKLYNARAAEVNLVRSELIEEGTYLGTIASESVASDLEQVKLSLRRAQDGLATGTKEREEAIYKKQLQLSSLSGTDREIARLELSKMQLALEDFKLSQERTIASLEKDIEKRTEQSIDQRVTAPITGGVSYFSYITPGDSLYYNQVIITFASPFPYILAIEDGDGQWRYGMEVTVEYGPRNNRGKCKGRIIAADNILPHEARNGYAFAVLDEEIDPRLLTMLNVKGTLYSLENVPTIPRKAARLSGGNDMVSIIEGSSIANRRVNLALTSNDGSWVVQGLEPGQVLIVD